jgi:enoyl-CoA hydratase/carnithine racemase
MAWKTLELEREGPILHVWLARPERRNALNGAALQEIVDLFTQLQTDFATRVVVLGGRGPSFCAGADRRDPPGNLRLSGDSDATPRERRFVAQLGRRALEAIEACEAVTLARLHGHAIGGGFALAIACDLRIAAEGTVFQIPEVELGIPLAWGASARLAREIGLARARELILVGERIDAAQALRFGLVNRVVAQPDLDGAVRRWAERLAGQPEVAVHMTKTQFRALARTLPLGDVTEADGDLLLAASRMGTARASFPTRRERNRGEPEAD